MTSRGKYQTIVADPPWKYGKWASPSNRKGQVYEMPYPTMTVREISDLSVAGLADDNCQLFLWTTNKYLPDAYTVLKVWGFKYSQTLVWVKPPRGTGQGGLFTPTVEFLIIGRKGRMPKKSRVDTTWWLVKRPHNSHSTKPEFFRCMIEAVSDPPRIELFARQKADGWDVWGNEVESDVEL